MGSLVSAVLGGATVGICAAEPPTAGVGGGSSVLVLFIAVGCARSVPEAPAELMLVGTLLPAIPVRVFGAVLSAEQLTHITIMLIGMIVSRMDRLRDIDTLCHARKQRALRNDCYPPLAVVVRASQVTPLSKQAAVIN
jgi:hypothetical protein